MQIANGFEVVSGQCFYPFGRIGLGDGAGPVIVGIYDGVRFDNTPCVIVQDGGKNLIFDETFFGKQEVDACAKRALEDVYASHAWHMMGAQVVVSPHRGSEYDFIRLCGGLFLHGCTRKVGEAKDVASAFRGMCQNWWQGASV